MPRYLLTSLVSTPRSGPLSVGTTPADAAVASNAASTTYAPSEQSKDFHVRLILLPPQTIDAVRESPELRRPPATAKHRLSAHGAVVCQFLEPPVGKRDGHRPFADRARDTLGRPVPHVAGGENAGH